MSDPIWPMAADFGPDGEVLKTDWQQMKPGAPLFKAACAKI
ncbi:MAG: hypothetical protein Q4P24_04920 [Rhodobacterales bacterium]|nr:hypothetical protein [Rhodobacterales bacterium]